MKMWKNSAAAVLMAILAFVSGAGVAQAQTTGKIGVFDSKQVFEGSAEGQRLQRVLSDKRTELKAKVDTKEDEARVLQQQLREGEFTLSEEKKSELQKDLQRKVGELDIIRQEATNNLKIEIEDVQVQLERKLLEIIQEVGAEQNYALILERNTQVVFASPAVDMTQAVIERFNQKYPDSGTPAAGQ